ncbi:adenylate/guanylate cyclase domain-containing protein [Tistrella bauzanensis]|uniref:adenylate/guanylate cyclase domain-containing protein n=1 Tax=Tistrella TaxID=171436 RepID=UPI0031F67D57
MPRPRNDATPTDIDAAEREAERLGGWMRIAMAVILLASLVVPLLIIRPDMIMTGAVDRRLMVALVTLGAFGLLGMVVVLLTIRRRHRRWMAWVFPLTDAVLLGGSVWAGLVLTGLPGRYALMLTAAALAPVLLAIAAIRLRPMAIMMVTGLLVMALGLPMLSNHDIPADPAVLAAAINGMHATPPNIGRLLMLVLAGVALAIAAARNRRMVARAVAEAARAGRLGRFLPAEIAAMMADPVTSPDALGGRRDLAIVFVDLRGSTAMAERLDPQATGRLLGDYRRRVGQVVGGHGGMIAGFVGDGVLALFGATGDADPAAAARAALHAARAIAADVEIWAGTALAAEGIPPHRPAVAVAVHAGPVYCGPVGDDARLDYTVIGDPVNVAARIESVAKQAGLAVVATDTVLDLAGHPPGWRSIGLCTLRGRSAGMVCHTAD